MTGKLTCLLRGVKPNPLITIAIKSKTAIMVLLSSVCLIFGVETSSFSHLEFQGELMIWIILLHPVFFQDEIYDLSKGPSHQPIHLAAEEDRTQDVIQEIKAGVIESAPGDSFAGTTPTYTFSATSWNWVVL